MCIQEKNNRLSDNVNSDASVVNNPPNPADENIQQEQNNLAELQQTLLALKDLFQKQIARNQNQTQMYDQLYAEMKDYKESFLLEVLHKPIIHNLINLYDSYVNLEAQLDDILIGVTEPDFLEKLKQHRKNLENFRYTIEEVLYRMDVTRFKESIDTLDKILHKTRNVEETNDPLLDNKIVEVHKKGFMWKEKVFRAEEVTILRYNANLEE